MILFNRHIKEYITVINEVNSELATIYDMALPLSGKLFNEFQSIRNSNLLVQSEVSHFQEALLNELNEDELDRLYRNVALEFISKYFTRVPNDSSYIVQKDNILDSISRDLNMQINTSNIIEQTLINIASSKTPFAYSKPEILVVCAVPKEFRAFFKRINVIKNWGKCNSIQPTSKKNINTIYDILDGNNDKKDRNDDYYIDGIISKTENGDTKNVNIVIVLLKQYGSLKSYQATKEIIRLFPSIKEVNLVGVCGYINHTENKKIGDILISKGFYDATLTKHSRGEYILKDKSHYPLNINSTYFKYDWKRKVELEKKPITQNRINTGKLNYEVSDVNYACSSSVIDDENIRKNILKQIPEADAVEMELKGCYDACIEEKREFVIIKSISDLATNKDKVFQAYCAGLASDFTVDYLISKYG